MTEPPRDRGPRHPVDRAFRSTVAPESTAFGFSIMITVTFGAVQWKHGSPDPGDMVLFALAAVAAFTTLEALASRGFREPLPEHHSIVMTLGTAMNFASVGLAVGTALLLSDAIGGDLAWPLCPASAATVYLLAETVETVLAERIQVGRGDPRATEVTD